MAVLNQKAWHTSQPIAQPVMCSHHECILHVYTLSVYPSGSKSAKSARQGTMLVCPASLSLVQSKLMVRKSCAHKNIASSVES